MLTVSMRQLLRLLVMRALPVWPHPVVVEEEQVVGPVVVVGAAVQI